MASKCKTYKLQCLNSEATQLQRQDGTRLYPSGMSSITSLSVHTNYSSPNPPHPVLKVSNTRLRGERLDMSFFIRVRNAV